MLDWYSNLYVSQEIKGKVRRIKARIEKGKIVPDVYLLTLSEHPDNILEIIAAPFLMQKGVRRRCPKIVGLARGWDSAVELMQEILKETYEKTGSFRVEKYIQDR